MNFHSKRSGQILYSLNLINPVPVRKQNKKHFVLSGSQRGGATLIFGGILGMASFKLKGKHALALSLNIIPFLQTVTSSSIIIM